MTPEEEKELTEHIDAIALILYRQAQPEQVKTKRPNRGDSKKTNTLCILVHELDFFYPANYRNNGREN